MRKMFYLLPLAALLAGVVLLNPWQSAKAQGMQLTATRDVVWKDFLGVNAHFLWFPPEHYRQQMQQWKALGLEWTRVDLHWDSSLSGAPDVNGESHQCASVKEANNEIIE